jgi:hypothetical protein
MSCTVLWADLLRVSIESYLPPYQPGFAAVYDSPNTAAIVRRSLFLPFLKEKTPH